MRVFGRDQHLEDATLLLAAEGELSSTALRRVQEHLLHCVFCRERHLFLRVAEAKIVLPAPPVQIDVARDRLLAKLREDQAPSPWKRWLGPRIAIQVGAMAMLLLAAFASWQRYSLPQSLLVVHEDQSPEPNHAITPGATRPVELTELCTLNDKDLDPRVSPEKQRTVFKAYGMDETEARAYQVDYLINPQLGGDDDSANLWPEPYQATMWNAKVKDALETRLHGMVCSGQIELKEAQHEIATDWIGAYQKHFHTTLPVKTVASLER
jgi:hypothetical protein